MTVSDFVREAIESHIERPREPSRRIKPARGDGETTIECEECGALVKARTYPRHWKQLHKKEKPRPKISPGEAHKIFNRSIESTKNM